MLRRGGATPPPRSCPSSASHPRGEPGPGEPLPEVAGSAKGTADRRARDGLAAQKGIAQRPAAGVPRPALAGAVLLLGTELSASWRGANFWLPLRSCAWRVGLVGVVPVLAATGFCGTSLSQQPLDRLRNGEQRQFRGPPQLSRSRRGAHCSGPRDAADPGTRSHGLPVAVQGALSSLIASSGGGGASALNSSSSKRLACSQCRRSEPAFP